MQETFNLSVLKNSQHNYGNNPIYILPDNLNEYDTYIKYIETLPSFTSPELVGLHLNADITKDINESNLLLDSLISCLSSSGSSGQQGKSQ